MALAARFAQHLNIVCDPAELPRKLDALDQRCAEAGRDRAGPETSFLAFVTIDESGDRARAQQRDYLNLVTNGHEPGVVDLAGRTLRALLG